MVYEEITREDKIEFIFDIYKSAHGFKPRHINFSEMSDAELDAFADRTIRENEIEMAREEAEQAEAAAKFEARVSDVIASGAGNRETAIRWIMQGEDADDLEHLAWSLGLPWRYFEQKEAA